MNDECYYCIGELWNEVAKNNAVQTQEVESKDQMTEVLNEKIEEKNA